ncbi:MAG: radical SAM/SPASM domain-containing protein, partial [Deltaproteobacteria bacterium]|nr:radical SAM/SPASM domain-containing protein [Deltaproteobacteria bacterium]
MGHEIFRVKGSFDKVVEAIKIAKDAEIKISIATMVHQGNLHEFVHMTHFINDIGACEWGIDA